MKKTSFVTFAFIFIWLWMGIFFAKRMIALKKTEEQRQKENFFKEDISRSKKNKLALERTKEGVKKEEKKIISIEKQSQERQKEMKNNGEEENASLFFKFEKKLPFSYPKTPNLFIYGDKQIDSYIQKKAELRGYTPHKEIPEINLKRFGEKRVAKEALPSLVKLIHTVREQGGDLRLISGYRSIQRQREIFTSKLGNVSKEEVLSGKIDRQIDAVLSRSSIPGYSKHHTGYAFDFICGEHGKLTQQFKESPCYRILSKNNFSLPKKYGFLPSYPEGETHQGPDPEPWEFVWVGEYAYE